MCPAVLAAAAALATGCPDFEVELPRPTGGPVVRAVAFGFAETNDFNGAAIARALAEARRVRAERVELAPGTYRCFDDTGIDLAGFSDFTLDGKGARLVFRRPVRLPGEKPPFPDCDLCVHECVRVRLCDFTCDWDWQTMPLGAFARAVAKHVDERADDGSFVDYELTDYSTARPHPAFGRPLPILVCNAMEESRRSFRRGGGGWCNGHTEGYHGAKTQWLSPSRVRVWPSVKDPAGKYRPCYDNYFSPRLNRETVRGVEPGGFYRLVHYYYGKGGLYFGNNLHLTVERCAVDSAFGCGVGINGCQRYWQFIDFRFGQPDDAPVIRPVTTTADAQHVGNSCGFCKYIRCRWNRNLDDTNNFHDGALLAKRGGARTLTAVNAISKSTSEIGAGSLVEVFEENYDATGARGRVVSVAGDDYTLDCDVPSPRFGLFVVRNASRGTDNILFRDCDLTDGCMRNLFQGSQVTVENCLFRRESGSPLRFMVEWTRDWWVEGTRATNIVVRGCTFDSNQIDNWAVDGVTSEIFCGARLAANGGGHDGTQTPPPGDEAVSRVLIEGNTFVNPRGALLHVVSGRDYVFRNNTVRITSRRPDDPPYRGTCLAPPGALTETGTKIQRAK